MAKPIEVKTTLEWNGDKFGPEFDRLITKSLNKAAILVENAAVKNVNFQVYQVPIPKTKSGKPKWIRSGFLKANMTRKIEKVRAFVGNNMMHCG